VRKLVPDPLEGGLTHQLGDHHRLRLVGEDAVGVELRRLRQERPEHLDHHIELVTPGGGARHDLVPRAELVDGDEVLGQLGAVDAVALSGDRDDGLPLHLLQLGQLTRDEGVTRARPLVGGQTEADDVHVEQRLPDQVVEPLPQQGPGLVQTRRVHEDQLGAGAHGDASDGVPRGLRL